MLMATGSLVMGPVSVTSKLPTEPPGRVTVKTTLSPAAVPAGRVTEACRPSAISAVPTPPVNSAMRTVGVPVGATVSKVMLRLRVAGVPNSLVSVKDRVCVPSAMLARAELGSVMVKVLPEAPLLTWVPYDVPLNVAVTVLPTAASVVPLRTMAAPFSAALTVLSPATGLRTSVGAVVLICNSLLLMSVLTTLPAVTLTLTS